MAAAATALVDSGKEPTVCPAGTVIDAGTPQTDALLLVRSTFAPYVPAALASVTVPVAVDPPLTSVVEMLIALTFGPGLTLSTIVLLVGLWHVAHEIVNVTEVGEVTGFVRTVGDAYLEGPPAGKETLVVVIVATSALLGEIVTVTGSAEGLLMPT